MYVYCSVDARPLLLAQPAAWRRSCVVVGGYCAHQLGGLWPPVSKTTVGRLFSLFLPRSHACALRAVSGRDGMLV